MNYDYADKDDLDRLTRTTRQADLDRDAWSWLMASPHGRRIARNLIGSTGILHRAFEAEPLVLAYREGKRSIGLDVMDAVRQHAPDQYPALFKDESNV